MQTSSALILATLFRAQHSCPRTHLTAPSRPRDRLDALAGLRPFLIPAMTNLPAGRGHRPTPIISMKKQPFREHSSEATARFIRYWSAKPVG
jgi:hypothetical protein